MPYDEHPIRLMMRVETGYFEINRALRSFRKAIRKAGANLKVHSFMVQTLTDCKSRLVITMRDGTIYTAETGDLIVWELGEPLLKVRKKGMVRV